MAQETRKERRARERKKRKNHREKDTPKDSIALPTRKNKNRALALLFLFLFCLGSAFYVGHHKGKKQENKVVEKVEIKVPQVSLEGKKFHDLLAMNPDDA